MDIVFCMNTFTFMLTCVQIQFKGPSRKISRLLSTRLSNVRLEFELSNLKAELKDVVLSLKKCF